MIPAITGITTHPRGCPFDSFVADLAWVLGWDLTAELRGFSTVQFPVFLIDAECPF